MSEGLHHHRACFETRSSSAPQHEGAVDGIKKFLILRRPRSGRLEERTASIQHVFDSVFAGWGGCSDGGDQSVQLLQRAGRAEHVAVRAYQNGRSVNSLKPGSQLGGVIDHERDIAIREASSVSAGRLAAKSGGSRAANR